MIAIKKNGAVSITADSAKVVAQAINHNCRLFAPTSWEGGCETLIKLLRALEFIDEQNRIKFSVLDKALGQIKYSVEFADNKRMEVNEEWLSHLNDGEVTEFEPSQFFIGSTNTTSNRPTAIEGRDYLEKVGVENPHHYFIVSQLPKTKKMVKAFELINGNSIFESRKVLSKYLKCFTSGSAPEVNKFIRANTEMVADEEVSNGQ